MTQTELLQRQDGTLATRIAVILTEIFAPVVLIVLLLFVVALRSTDSLGRGLLIAAVTSFFVGLLPYVVLMLSIRKGRLGDRHLRERSERPAMMAFGLASALVGVAAAWALDAPRDVFALLAAMVAGIVVALAISLTWKVSIHAACLAGTVAVLAIVGGWLWLAGLIAVVATGWARVHLGDHTAPQVIVGALVGSAIAALVFTALR